MENKICAVHKILLNKIKVPIRYGLYDTDPEFCEATRVLFPNAHSFASGGCEIQDEFEVEKYVCEECRRDEAAWQNLMK